MPTRPGNRAHSPSITLRRSNCVSPRRRRRCTRLGPGRSWNPLGDRNSTHIRRVPACADRTSIPRSLGSFVRATIMPPGILKSTDRDAMGAVHERLQARPRSCLRRHAISLRIHRRHPSKYVPRRPLNSQARYLDRGLSAQSAAPRVTASRRDRMVTYGILPTRYRSSDCSAAGLPRRGRVERRRPLLVALRAPGKGRGLAPPLTCGGKAAVP